MSTILSGVSNLKDFLTNWNLPAVNEGWDHGAVWGSETGLITDIGDLPKGGQYTQWGDGLDGADGVLLESDTSFQYQEGNLTGNVNTLTFGSGFASSDADGMSLANSSLKLDLDQSFNYDAVKDSFDDAIRGIMDNSLNGLYAYLAETGAVVMDTSGDDMLVGFAGEDRFVFSGGNDIIANDGPAGTYGYQNGTDLLDITLWDVADFGQLEIYDINGDAYVEYGDNSIQLVGIDSSVLDASDFIFATQQSDYGLAA